MATVLLQGRRQYSKRGFADGIVERTEKNLELARVLSWYHANQSGRSPTLERGIKCRSNGELHLFIEHRHWQRNPSTGGALRGSSTHDALAPRVSLPPSLGEALIVQGSRVGTHRDTCTEGAQELHMRRPRGSEDHAFGTSRWLTHPTQRSLEPSCRRATAPLKFTERIQQDQLMKLSSSPPVHPATSVL